MASIRLTRGGGAEVNNIFTILWPLTQDETRGDNKTPTISQMFSPWGDHIWYAESSVCGIRGGGAVIHSIYLDHSPHNTGAPGCSSKALMLTMSLVMSLWWSGRATGHPQPSLQQVTGTGPALWLTGGSVGRAASWDEELAASPVTWNQKSATQKTQQIK